MIADARDGELYVKWVDEIDDREIQDAFCYLVGRAAALRSLTCCPRQNTKRSLRFCNSSQPDEVPYSCIINQNWLLFYFRKPAVDSGEHTVESLSEEFDSVAVNKSGERTVKLKSIADVRRLFEYLRVK